MSHSDELTPDPAAGRSTELQQLEAALAAGVITPELFATLKAKLHPSEPAAAPPLPTPAPQRVPPAPVEELPSLLDMFSRAPAPAETPSAPPASVARPAAPPPASPPRPTAAAEEAAARQRIAEQLAKMRQEPPAPAPPPSFYPEPKPAPTFYPEPKPAPPVAPAAPVAVAAPVRPAAPPPRPPRPGREPVSEGRTGASWFIIVLLIGVIAAVAYFATSSSHPNEELTSPALPTTEPVPPPAPAPVVTKHKKPARKPRHKAKAAPVAASVPPPDFDSTETTVASTASPAVLPPKAVAAPPAARPIPAAGEPGDDAAATRVRAAMASYYADLYAPPLHASEHFAPQVERLYIRQNLTPDAIDAELGRSFFPDNQQATARIEPGTLRVSDPAADGSRTATFTEQMRLYRPSLQKYQRLRTQVRVRFNAAYQIVYMRQEKLLSNTFEE
ncbi:hypothetical protein GKZ68_15510 [Hymenobacter sp. BRD128]|uniref:hypothetical protein n=1 Tax=Hymenobacter sp. BRD128 TaxID=2675878 RepID=UPI001563D89C|nr:hypothetical protein [Hymenobacter sp. BRD128]QKG57911.1 hypothetical protein GKZ68_15510 [Hymenobacter sp. BRD128]